MKILILNLILKNSSDAFKIISSAFFIFLIQQTTTTQTLKLHENKFQNDKITKEKIKERINELKFGSSSLNNRLLTYNQPRFKLNSFENAELIGSTKNFDIYKLPLDNMPCAAPNKVYAAELEAMKKKFVAGNGNVVSVPIPNAVIK